MQIIKTPIDFEKNHNTSDYVLLGEWCLAYEQELLLEQKKSKIVHHDCLTY